jgi:hypothetical protein
VNAWKLLTKVLKVLHVSQRRSIKLSIGNRKMPSRTIAVRTLGIALLSVLLCAIIASELPELLTLTDNAANDYALRSTDLLVLPILDSAKIVEKPTIEFNISTQDSLFGRIGSAEETESALCGYILHFVLRT